MKITAQDMLRFGVIDTILTEPVGGAHRDPAAMINATGEAIAQRLRRTARAGRARPSASSGDRNSSISAANSPESIAFRRLPPTMAPRRRFWHLFGEGPIWP